jgi:uncharacterized lipoprotein YajG
MSALRRSASILTILILAGCARGMSVESASPGESYSISVENLTGVTMVVTYTDGRGDATLGTVNAGATERFIISAPSTSTIRVQGAAISGGRRSGPYTVTLAQGATHTVRLR